MTLWHPTTPLCNLLPFHQFSPVCLLLFIQYLIIYLLYTIDLKLQKS